jgi:hypothetical protein
VNLQASAALTRLSLGLLLVAASSVTISERLVSRVLALKDVRQIITSTNQRRMECQATLSENVLSSRINNITVQVNIG